MFVTPKDTPAVADAEQPGDQVIFRVTDIVVPKTDMKSDEAKTISQNLTRSLSEDVFSQYIGQVEHEIGVTINGKAVSQAVSGNSNPDDTDVNY
jgi:peptidyl-prolyl cis-trans isomerase D